MCENDNYLGETRLLEKTFARP